jgi:hypothetical protein
MEDSYLNLYGDMAEKIMKNLTIGDKVSLTVSGKVEELSDRESMDYVMSSEGEKSKRKKSNHYCVRVAVTSAK